MVGDSSKLPVVVAAVGSAAVVLALLRQRRFVAGGNGSKEQPANGSPPCEAEAGGAGTRDDYDVPIAQRVDVRCVQAGGAAFGDNELGAALEALRDDGVVCLKGLFSHDQITEFRSVYDVCWEKTKLEISRPVAGRSWSRRIYSRMGGPQGSRTAALDKGLYHRVPTMYIGDEGESVVRMGRGRFDFACGMGGTVLGSDDLLRPTPLLRILTNTLGPDSEWLSYPGGLPAEGACGAGRWHRDIFSLWEDEGTRDADLSPWYFTMIAPMTTVTQADGPTQFRLGSHRMAADKVGSAPFCSPNVEVGDALVFDGRVVHRGGPRAKQVDARHALYCVHHKWWYQDNEIGVGNVARLEPVTADEVANMESEDPWLRKRSPFCVSELKHTGLSMCDRGHASAMLMGASLATLMGYVAKSS